MCGRFSLRALMDDLTRHLREHYRVDDIADDLWVPRYNLAPGQNVLAVVHDGKQHRVGTVKWGFIPFFAKEEDKGKTGIINAKAETVAEKPSFRTSFSRKRCVILADGFYEWKKGDSAKTPMRIFMKDESIFPLAGIWETVYREDGTKVSTCAILTTTPNDLMASIHNRMPVILTAENEKIWLNPLVTDPALLQCLLRPYEASVMDSYPISTLVNNAKLDSPDIIVRV